MLFSAADFLSVLLLVKFIRNVPPVIPLEPSSENPTFSPALSSITELEPSNSLESDFDNHLLRQHELDIEEQNARDVESFDDFISGSGYNGLFWDDIES